MAVKATLRLKDSMGRIVTKKVETNQDTLALAIGAIDDYIIDLAVVSDLELIQTSYSEKGPVTQVFAGAASSNVDTGATFTVKTASGKLASHHVPGFPQALAGAEGKIDVTQNEVVTYFANFLAGGSLRLSDGEAVSSVISGSMDK